MFKQGSFRHSSIQGLRQGALSRWRRVDPGGLIHGPEARRPTPQTLVIAPNLKSVAWAGCPRPGSDSSIYRWGHRGSEMGNDLLMVTQYAWSRAWS